MRHIDLEILNEYHIDDLNKLCSEFENSNMKTKEIELPLSKKKAKMIKIEDDIKIILSS